MWQITFSIIIIDQVNIKLYSRIKEYAHPSFQNSLRILEEMVLHFSFAPDINPFKMIEFGFNGTNTKLICIFGLSIGYSSTHRILKTDNA